MGLYLGDVIKGPMTGTRHASLSLIEPGLWARILGLGAHYFKPDQLFPQPLTKASVGKGCTVSRIRGDTHVANQEGFDLGFVAIQRLVIMMAS